MTKKDKHEHEKKHSADQSQEEKDRAAELAEAATFEKEKKAKEMGLAPQSGTAFDEQQEIKGMSDKEKAAYEEKVKNMGPLGAEVKAEDAPEDEVIDPNPTIPGMYIGAHVLYYKREQSQHGLGKLRAAPAIICDFADAAGNFQPKDGAANLTIFTVHGGAVETRHSIRYSKEPMEGRWSFNPHAKKAK